MLTLQLTLDNKQTSVHVDEQESHSFSLLDLGQTNEEWKDFFKDPRPYGGKLFDTLFKDGSKARIAFDELSKQSERTIVLILESSELDGIAWEYAFHDNTYIVEDFAFMRVLPEKERPHTNGRLSKSVERVPLLFIPANPLVDLSGEPMRELDIESEWREMTQHIAKSNAPFDLIELRPATPVALQSIMARFQNGMIAHFSGHGAATKDGAFLLFENENGSSNPLEAREFVREVKDQAWIGFLSACQSAVAERTAFGNLARELVKAGVPFALGMQFNLPDPFAQTISGQFYNYLSQGHAVPEAARQARRAVKRENEFYVGMIALYAAHPVEAGKINWTGSDTRTVPTFAAADVSDLPTPSGFIGRQRELMNIGTILMEKKKPNTVTLHGAGGIGKTALMHQALLRFAPLYEATLAVALDPLPSLESVLGRLERFLNLPSPCSNDTKERERIVRERVTNKRTLLGLDNFEILNYALNEKDSDEEKTAKSLHSFFKYLAANGVTMCVTSREVTNLGGETIEDIQGLTNENGGRLFQENVIRQKGEIYIEKTQQVSEMVGGHPLALRLLASAFDDQVGRSLDQYIEDLQSFLLKSRDKWTEEDRHENLKACFTYSLENLAKTERGKILEDSLSRLSLFVSYFVVDAAAPILINRFIEDNLEQWQQSVQVAIDTIDSLWERGFIERISVPLNDSFLYLCRLPPSLTPFAKLRLKDTTSVREIYWKSMKNIAQNSLEHISQNPAIADVAYYALPDLKIASSIQKEKPEEIIEMQLLTSSLLSHFGHHNDSLILIEKSINIFRSQEMRGNKQGIYTMYANVLSLKGRIYTLHGNLGEAKTLFKQALEMLDKIGHLKGKGAVLHKLADIVAYTDINEAIKLYKESLDIAQRFGDIQGKAITSLSLGRLYALRKDFNNALKLSKQSIDFFDNLGDLKNKADAMMVVASINFDRREFDNVLNYCQNALILYEDINYPLGKSEALLLMANAYAGQSDFQKALKTYRVALELVEQLDNKRAISNVLSGMAYIYMSSTDLETAKDLYLQVLKVDEEIGDLLGKGNTLSNLGLVLFQNKEYVMALRNVSQAIEIFENLGSPLDIEAARNLLIEFKNHLGLEKFQTIWAQEIKQSFPKWIS